MTTATKRLTTWQSLKLSFQSWRFGSVTLQSFPSGLPLGIVIITIPYWLQQSGVDIKSIGLLTAAQIPYAFKFVWAPLVDRYAPKWGRKRFWMLLTQLLLAATFFLLTRIQGAPPLITVAIVTLVASFLSATQDIAIDAYAIEVLRKEELSLAVGARNALARAGIFVARLLNTFGPRAGWRSVFGMVSVLFAPFWGVTLAGPEPEVPIARPRSLGAAVWEPFVGFFRHPRALEIAAFLFLYKYADNLATSLISPFFGQAGYSSGDVGLAQGTIGLICTLTGTLAGGLLTVPLGLGRALWIFGVFQALANLGYAWVAHLGGPAVDHVAFGVLGLHLAFPPAMYFSVALEAIASALGTGAFGVFLMRLTQREFSATQYALFSSIFALGRTLAGPPAGTLVDAMGWQTFFLITPLCALPGLLMLQRFAPWSARDVQGMPDEQTGASEARGTPVTRGGAVARGLLGMVLGAALTYGLDILLTALKASRGHAGFHLAAAAFRIFHPVRGVDYADVLAPPLVGLFLGLATAAYVVARRGLVPEGRARPA